MSILVRKEKLPKQQIRDTLFAILVVKEKFKRIRKEYTCTYRRKQRSWYNKSKSTLLTIHTDTVMITSDIEGYKDRVVEIEDIKGVYLDAN